VISRISLFCATSPEAVTIGIFPSMAGYYAVRQLFCINVEFGHVQIFS
jgi:hypothetical protein